MCSSDKDKCIRVLGLTAVYKLVYLSLPIYLARGEKTFDYQPQHVLPHGCCIAVVWLAPFRGSETETSEIRFAEKGFDVAYSLTCKLRWRRYIIYGWRTDDIA